MSLTEQQHLDRAQAAANRAVFREDVHETVQGVLARFGRAYFMEKARTGGSITELWQDMADKGLMAVGVPEEQGGVGGGISGMVTIVEEMAMAGCPPVLYILTAFSREAIIHHGSPELVAAHVGATLTGERKICFGVTEPDAGTNAFAMRTRARPGDDGSFTLNGQKAFITGVDDADHILLIARSAEPGEPVGRSRGFTLFILPVDTPGISKAPMDIDYYAPERQFEVFLSDVHAPASSVVGEVGHGFEYLFSSLNAERLVISAWAVGLGDFALRKGVEYAKTRAPFGSPIGSYQGVQHPLALAKAHLEAAHVMLHQAAGAYDDGIDVGPRANMAKLLASKAALGALEASIQTHGGHAFVNDTDVSTLWPMIRSMQVAPINNESILNYIGEHVLGLPKSFATR